VYFDLAEATNWEVKPWEWPDVPDYWREKATSYFQAKQEVMPVLQAKWARRAKEAGG
jgi:hypothetical protein